MAEIDAVLSRAAEAVPVPDADRFAEAVASRVRSAGAAAAPGPPARAGARRQAFAVAAALVVVCALVGTLVGPVRSAVADLLGVDGVHITRAGPLPLPTPTSTQPTSGQPTTTSSVAPAPSVPSDPVAALHLGTVTTLDAAARTVGFDMRVPTIAGYQHPDVVLVGTPPAGGMVSMVYLPKPGRTTVPGEGVAGLLSEFRGHLDAGFFEKLVSAGTTVQTVEVAGVPGYWLSGAPHEFLYVTPNGQVDTETIRLAANTLLWSAAGITYRFESALALQSTVAIANSMRDAGTVG
jgi:hypothetical protein